MVTRTGGRRPSSSSPARWTRRGLGGRAGSPGPRPRPAARHQRQHAEGAEAVAGGGHALPGGIPRARELFTIFFDEDIRVSRYDSENQQGLFDRIHAAKGGGNTALYDAIAVYLSRVQDGAGRKVLVLFTDGEDSRSALGLSGRAEAGPSGRGDDLPHRLRHVRRAAVARARPRAFLEQLADDDRGRRCSAPRTSRELAGIYQKILDELAAQYVIGYVSDNPARDGKFRKIKVATKVPGLSVRHRTGYTPREDLPPAN